MGCVKLNVTQVSAVCAERWLKNVTEYIQVINIGYMRPTASHRRF